MDSTTSADLARLADWVFNHPPNCQFCGVTEFGDECLHPNAGISICSCQRSIRRETGLGPCPEEDALVERMREAEAASP